MRSKLMLFSEGLIRDAEENKITAYNILEDVLVAGFPLIFPRLCVLSVVEKEPGDDEKHKANVRMTLDETEIFKTEIDISFEGKPIARSIMVLGNLVIQKPGELTCTLAVGGKSLQQYSMNLRSLPPTMKPAAAP